MPSSIGGSFDMFSQFDVADERHLVLWVETKETRYPVDYQDPSDFQKNLEKDLQIWKRIPSKHHAEKIFSKLQNYFFFTQKQKNQMVAYAISPYFFNGQRPNDHDQKKQPLPSPLFTLEVYRYKFDPKNHRLTFELISKYQSSHQTQDRHFAYNY
jgi:hypothetical protein